MSTVILGAIEAVSRRGYTRHSYLAPLGGGSDRQRLQQVNAFGAIVWRAHAHRVFCVVRAELRAISYWRPGGRVSWETLTRDNPPLSRVRDWLQ